MKFSLLLTVLAANAFIQCNAADYYWSVAVEKNPADKVFNFKVASWRTDLRTSVLTGSFESPICFFTIGGFGAFSDIYTGKEVAICNRDGLDTELRFYGSGTTLTHIQVVDDTPVEHCMLVDNNASSKTYLCSSEFPKVIIPVTTTTTTTTTVVPTTTITSTTITSSSTASSSSSTAATTPAPSCTVGYLGKGNGKGPTNACCSTSDDCKDSCVKGLCGKGVDVPTTTTKPGNPAPTCTSGYKGKGNGKGPTNACCSSSNDCNDSCVKGFCSTGVF
ncbi:hypothetical protein MFLAVUS_007800 [Mucor flavus]|uniref:Uncharacterized protein n=1 Tax=Mucor flavus TaxID=439312 RepID=A0ABP9Z5G5_9FUNG